MPQMVLQGVTKQFADTEVIRSVDLAVDQGEFIVFVGPSGCGKSTLLRMLAGLEQVSSGVIEIDGADVTRMLPLERGVAMVFQSYALYPHMTVEENIGFGLKIAGLPRAERRAKVLEAARILQLEPYLQRRPKALSGGQRQRVAIGRAIVKNPRIFLFDEPLSNLDAELRVLMRQEIARLHQELGATMIYVTHDQVEAMTLADRIVVLRAGQVEQIGAPTELYADPHNLFVAGFIGSPKINVVTATIRSVSDNVARIDAPALGLAPVEVALRGKGAESGAQSGASVSIGVRPEHLVTGSGGFEGHVSAIERLGNVSYLYLKTRGGAAITVEQRGSTGLKVGDALAFALEPGRTLLFDADGLRL